MAMTDEPDDVVGEAIELPVEGYPYSEQSLTDWFRRRHARDPSTRELGALQVALAQRDSTPPHEGPNADLEGWRTDLSAPPADRR
jgi:hypothetical protein